MKSICFENPDPNVLEAHLFGYTDIEDEIRKGGGAIIQGLGDKFPILQEIVDEMDKEAYNCEVPEARLTRTRGGRSMIVIRNVRSSDMDVQINLHETFVTFGNG